ncbi:CXXC-type zinc finger protein 1 [Rhizophlyctis rosea]|nr:CXXC-type zinc finger protein 1 [Rhizophlyctis rosea]
MKDGDQTGAATQPPGGPKRRNTIKVDRESTPAANIAPPSRRTSLLVEPTSTSRRTSTAAPASSSTNPKAIVKVKLNTPAIGQTVPIPSSLPVPSLGSGISSAAHPSPQTNGHTAATNGNETSHTESVTNCICDNPTQEVDAGFMIACDGCDIWFHGRCVGIPNEESHPAGSWYCPRCTGVRLPLPQGRGTANQGPTVNVALKVNGAAK